MHCQNITVSKQEKMWQTLILFMTVNGKCYNPTPLGLLPEPNVSKEPEYKNFQSKKEGKDPELIQSSITPDTGYQWESDNVIIRHHKRKPRGQPFPSS